MLKPIQPDFKSIFEFAPGSNLILSPDLIIVAVSDAYLKATMTKRLDLIGKPLFKIFPDNPTDHNTISVSSLRFSLNYVLEHKTVHRMEVQKYDIRRLDGTFEEKYLQPLNTPVFNDQQELVYIIHNVEEVTQSKKEEEKLKSRNFSLTEAQRIAKIGDWTYHMNGDLNWSDNMYQLYGLPSKISTTTPAFFFELVHPGDREKMQQWMQKCLAGQKTDEFEFRSILPNGSIHYYNGAGEMKYDKQNAPLYLQGTVQDITERKEAEQKLIKANRLYFFISQINQMIVRTTDEETLYKEACHIAVDHGKFRMAWIGMIDEATKKLVPLMHAGEERDYLSKIKIISVNDIPEGNGPTGTVLRQGQYFICNDIENDPQMAFWKEAALERGYLSSMAIPIKKFGKVVGVFSFYASEKNFFDAEEIALLEEATGDVAFALEIFDKEKQRQKANADLERTNERLLIAQEIAHNGYWEMDLINGQHYWSDELFKIFDIQNTGTAVDVETYMSLIHPEDRQMLSDSHIAMIEKNIPLNLEFRFLKNDGDIKYLLAKAKLIVGNEGRPVRIEGTTQDITDRKLAVLELQLSEYRTKKIFKSGIIGFIYWDTNGEILDANDYFLEMTGYTKQDLKEKKISWSKMTPHEYAELDRIALEQIANTGICQPYEKEYIRKDGTRVPVLLGATVIEGNKLEKGLAYVMDISERKKAEKKLEENENYLRTILNTEPECVKILNSKGELLSMNPAGLSMIEADNEEQVLGHRMTELVDEKYRIGFNRLSKEVFNGNSGTYEFEVTGLKGGHRWLETHAVPLKNSEGKIVSLLGVTRDITERKKAQDEILQNQTRLNEAQRISHIGNWEIDLVTNTHIWSDEFYNILGVARKDKQPSPEGFLSSLHPDDFNRVKELIERTFVTFESSSFNARVFTPNGNIKDVYSHWQFEFDKNQKPLRLYGVLQDITESKKAEEEIKSTTEQLRQLTIHLQTIREEERKRIARELHDELGQQLAAIKMDVVWIDNQIPDETTKIKGKLQNIVELLDGGHKAVRRILNELRPPVLDDNSLLEAIQWLAQQFTESTGMPVHFTSNQQNIKFHPEYATCIFRVYQESLTNIMRHAGADKVVSSLNIVNDNIELAIEDDGNGFVTELAENNRKFGLLGMKERVVSLKGKFDLVSSPGKGTKIKIKLPLLE